MEKRRLGNSDLQISTVGIGAWAMGGGGWAWSWGPQDDQDSITAIHTAIDHGMNWIDTAAVYGLGHAEEVVGKAIRSTDQRPYVFTKCERVWNADGAIRGSLQPESIRRECEASLTRLGVEVIDLYQIHWPEPEQDLEEGWAEMARLKNEGKVRHIGVSNFNAEQIRRAQQIAPVTSLQPPYSMLSREIEVETLPFCLQQGIGTLVYSPMASGLLAGSMTRDRIARLPDDDWRKRSANFQEPRLSSNLRLVQLLKEIAARHGRTPGEVAIAWTLANKAVTGAIVGIRNRKQVEGIAGALQFRLSCAERQEINTALMMECQPA